ncbi:MAG: Crp/Fnr family transcriptional regulator [Cyanobacterium sp. T60_A2020_053]|nr:Crp/Fnr family transcriptional regulator [Cyanobacterium sp. T60_A2020_053]
METQEFAELFPLFHNLNKETLEWLISLVKTETYQAGEVIINHDDWGSGFHLITSGWVKVQHLYSARHITVEIIGRGGFVGEAGILGNHDFNSQVEAISTVTILTISAQRFIQILFRENQIQNRFLKIVVNRVTEYQKYYRYYHQTGKVRLVTILISLAEKYGENTENGIAIYNFSAQDLGDLAILSEADSQQILDKLVDKELINIDRGQEILILTNLKQLHHILGKLGNE